MRIDLLASPLASCRVADRDDIARGEACPIKRLTERPRTDGTLPSMHHRIDPIAAAVSADPRPAAGSKRHGAACVQYITAATSDVRTEALRGTKLEDISAAKVAGIAQSMMLLNASEVPGPAKPAGVKGHSSTFGIVRQLNDANVRWNIAVTDPGIQNSCTNPIESAERRTTIQIGGRKNPATDP